MSGSPYFYQPSGSSSSSSITQNQIFVSIGNGHGSTNTKIRRYTTTNISVGSDITYADSSTNGASFTINTSGGYSITLSDDNSIGIFTIGISVNGTALTTAIYSVSFAQGYRASNQGTAGSYKALSTTLYLSSGDVVRPQDDGNCDANDVRSFFNIIRVF